MACSYLYNKNVYIRCLFVVFAPDLVIPPSVFGGKNGFVRGMESEPLATFSLQVGNLPAGMFPSHISALEIVQARTK